jgi:hypothetical protein
MLPLSAISVAPPTVLCEVEARNGVRARLANLKAKRKRSESKADDDCSANASAAVKRGRGGDEASLAELLRAFFRSHEVLYVQVLTFHSLDLAYVMRELAAVGLKPPVAQLRDFLSKEGIVFAAGSEHSAKGKENESEGEVPKRRVYHGYRRPRI